MVNAQVLQGQWNRVRGQLQQRWGQLTEDDLKFASGDIDQLVGRLQQRTGEARDSIEKYLDDLTKQGASAISQASETAGEYTRYATDQAREGYHRMADQLGRGYESSRELIRENPGGSVALVFGVGIMFGVVLGLALRSR